MKELSIFETIITKNEHPIFLEKHLARLDKAVHSFHLIPAGYKEKTTPSYIHEYIRENCKTENVLKISISQNSIDFLTRRSSYTREQYEKGIHLDFAENVRDETSPFSYIKSNQNEINIIEKELAKRKGIDEPVFLNTKGFLTEGAISNLFFVKNNQLITPAPFCGLLRGIIRDYLVENYKIEEKEISPSEIPFFEEMFVTNSIMGIMPVHSIGNHIFHSSETTRNILRDYLKTTGLSLPQ